MDVVLSVLLLVVLAPVLILTAVAVKIGSRGPVLFKQTRVGSRREIRDSTVLWSGRMFTIYKFRSMVRDADETLHRDYIESFVNGGAEDSTAARSGFKLSHDSRVTLVGKFIRRTSIDELPQLFNVLVGDMSLVGPRPVPPYEVDAYGKNQMERLHAKPGITGYWQIRGRGVVPFKEMIEMDVFYSRNHTLLLDLRLLLLTLPAVVWGRGAK